MKKKCNAFRDYSAESNIFIYRSLIAFFGILLLSTVLIANLYYLQITCFEIYQTRSNENRIKLVPIAPSRGIIYSSNGEPLALNHTIYQLELMPEKVKNLPETLQALRPIVELTDEDIANFEKERKRASFFTSIILKTHLTELQIARFAINQFNFPGIEINAYQKRYYPYVSSMTHVIGYVAKINDKELERLNKEGMLANYSATYDIGKLGIERYYESILHGKAGYEEIEVNNRGRVIRKLKEQPPQAGKDIYLTLDLKLQIYIQKLISRIRGAVVVTDPKSGGILALVSNPSYDANLFVNGISRKNYQALLNDPNRPFINRVTQGVYPPASTVKPYIIVSALSDGVINKNTNLVDPGWWKLPGSGKRFRDWKKLGHGNINIIQAIEESSDTFFYQIAFDMGINRLSEWMTKFGYGKYTGIDLSEEVSGIMPTSEWKKKRYKKPWYIGDTIPVGIGQGYWSATPIQMTKVLMTLVNNGIVKSPHLLSNIKVNGILIPYKQKEQSKMSDVHSQYWDIAKLGMYGVANHPNGTVYRSFSDAPYKAAVKSGTAQVYSYENYNTNKISEHLRDHKLMTAFGPFDNPKAVITVVLENGGLGANIGSITRQILDYTLCNYNKKN